jgi:hypothetical protein
LRSGTGEKEEKKMILTREHFTNETGGTLEQISPAQAEAWLNTGWLQAGRLRYPVAKYQHFIDMLMRDEVLPGQIIIVRDSILDDGRHRCSAIFASGITGRCRVFRASSTYRDFPAKGGSK